MWKVFQISRSNSILVKKSNQATYSVGQNHRLTKAYITFSQKKKKKKKKEKEKEKKVLSYFLYFALELVL